MNFGDKCRFCDIVNEKYHYNEIDQPWLDTGEFVALASIGALVEGWSLVVPKKHQLSMKDVYKKTEFQTFMQTTITHLSHYYGPLITFEHGSNKEGSITSCGTNHAHLHIVPFKQSLLEDIQNSDLHWIQCKTSQIAQIVESEEYLFYSDLNQGWEDPVGYLHVLKFPISQFFRHIIAKKLNKSEMANYKDFPFIEIAQQTQKVLVEPIAMTL